MTDSSTQPKNTETMEFQAEVGRLLDIVAHSLYSEKEVFLRELIANAADAAEKQRFLNLSAGVADNPAEEYAIHLSADPVAKTLRLSDNGIGMDRSELIDHLGTIARSGTGKFLQENKTSSDSAANLEALIGQFGVGFYSAFMVAERVEVISLKQNESQAYHWQSDGKGSFTVGESTRPDGRGTTVILHLREGAEEYLEAHRLRQLVRRYSNHLALPVYLDDPEGGESERLNDSQALWLRPRSEVTAEELKDFYQSLSHDGQEPRATVHIRAEGSLEYSALIFIPRNKPFDLFLPERKSGLKLYVRRVFITDEGSDLIAPYLRFVKGVVDSSDLPLNVSRELLQNNPILPKIRRSLTKKILSEIEKLSHDSAAYESFWQEFGAVFKEGLYEDFENREEILKLARFKSSEASGWSDLSAYVARMKPGQEFIYCLSGESPEALISNPHLEGFKAKGVEVIYLTDPIDEFWLQSVSEFQGKAFRSITRGAAELSKIGETKTESAEQKSKNDSQKQSVQKLAELFKGILATEVKSVELSERLTESAVCLVAESGDIDLNFEKLLKQHQRVEKSAKRVLEINPDHPLIQKLAKDAEAGRSERIEDRAWLLLAEARLALGEALDNPSDFARRLERVLI
ncbi:MAG: molecular chaperone HtpG [Candidatus Pacebacteria bacterium]|nr:molecular chaperone HtpG [Candidatus Paceibacterota bacterium]